MIYLYKKMKDLIQLYKKMKDLIKFCKNVKKKSKTGPKNIKKLNKQSSNYKGTFHKNSFFSIFQLIKRRFLREK